MYTFYWLYTFIISKDKYFLLKCILSISKDREDSNTIKAALWDELLKGCSSYHVGEPYQIENNPGWCKK